MELEGGFLLWYQPIGCRNDMDGKTILLHILLVVKGDKSQVIAMQFIGCFNQSIQFAAAGFGTADVVWIWLSYLNYDK